jgi:hypothetical protein
MRATGRREGGNENPKEILGNRQTETAPLIHARGGWIEVGHFRARTFRKEYLVTQG